MRVFYSVDDIPALRNAVVTVGSYDGVHYGHRVLLRHVKDKAVAVAGESVVVTFWPHPRKVLPSGGHVRLLNTLKEKMVLLAEAGIDNLVVLPFTPEFAAMGSCAFVRDILVDRIGMKYFVVGYNHRFGADRGGDYESLKAVQTEYGFETEMVERNDVHDEKVSSTVVRRMIEDGEMTRAKEFLTRGFLLIADIRGGMVIVRDSDKLMPPSGRYSVTVNYGEDEEDDILRIDGDGAVTLERGVDGNMEDVLITFV